MATSQKRIKKVSSRTLEQPACHADELHQVVQAAADRHDDPHLRLAAESLDQLNDDLNELAYE